MMFVLHLLPFSCGRKYRKCSSVPTSFCGQCAHSLSSLESQVCLQRPFSIARLCSLSLYIVKAFLKFGSVTVVKYSAFSVYGSVFLLIISNVSSNYVFS